MGVRPPSNDIDDEPGTIEFGIAALDARIDNRDISFPISATDLNAAHGDIRVSVDSSGNKIALSEALAECDQDRFDSKQHLLNALHPIFEHKREQISGSIVGRLRSLLPF